MKFKAKMLSMYVLVIALALNLCAVGTNPITSDEPVVYAVARSATINRTSSTLVKGQRLTMKISNVKSTISWTSSNKKVATVNAKGVVSAKAKGSATITAKFGTKKLTCKLKVEAPKISASKATVKKGKTKKIKITGTSQKIKWTSSKKSVATVSKTGVVYGKKAGTTTITAKLASGKTYKCKITVKTVATTVYITRTGSKYRKAGCRYLRQSKIAISLKNAKAAGYEPCSVCY